MSDASERLRSIGRTLKGQAARNGLLAEEQESAGEKYLAIAARVDAAITAAELDVLSRELEELNALTTARTDRIMLLNQL